MRITIEVTTLVTVELPEEAAKQIKEDGDNVTGWDLTDEAEERAIEAVVSAFPEEVGIHIDGPDKPYALVSFDMSDNDCEYNGEWDDE